MPPCPDRLIVRQKIGASRELEEREFLQRHAKVYRRSSHHTREMVCLLCNVLLPTILHTAKHSQLNAHMQLLPNTKKRQIEAESDGQISEPEDEIQEVKPETEGFFTDELKAFEREISALVQKGDSAASSSSEKEPSESEEPDEPQLEAFNFLENSKRKFIGNFVSAQLERPVDVKTGSNASSGDEEDWKAVNKK